MEKGLLPEIAAELYEAVPLTSPLLSHRLGWQGAMRRCDRLLLRRPRGAAIEKATTRNWSWGRGWRGTGLRSSWVQPWRPARRQAGVFGVLEGLDVDAYARPDGELPPVRAAVPHREALRASVGPRSRATAFGAHVHVVVADDESLRELLHEHLMWT